MVRWTTNNGCNQRQGPVRCALELVAGIVQEQDRLVAHLSIGLTHLVFASDLIDKLTSRRTMLTKLAIFC